MLGFRGGANPATARRVTLSARTTRSFLLLVTMLGVAPGCASAPAPAVVAQVEAPERVDLGPSSYESEIGGMNEAAVDARFATLKDPIFGCVEQGSARVRVLGGHFQLALRIDRQGEVATAFLKESTLGDRDTEKCILDLARAATWPKPVGGEGLAERSFDVDPPAEPVMWDEKKVKHAVGVAAAGFKRCTRGATGTFVATAYVKPNGHILSAGVAPPSAVDDPAVECIVSTIEKMRFASPGRKPAKVTFALP
jgi:hypothetical protein